MDVPISSGYIRQAMGAHYRHTIPEMAARIATAIEQRLRLVLEFAWPHHGRYGEKRLVPTLSTRALAWLLWVLTLPLGPGRLQDLGVWNILALRGKGSRRRARRRAMVMADIDVDPEVKWIYGHQLAVSDE